MRGSCIGTAGGVAMRVERDRVVVQEYDTRDGSRAAVERVLELEQE